MMQERERSRVQPLDDQPLTREKQCVQSRNGKRGWVIDFDVCQHRRTRRN